MDIEIPIPVLKVINELGISSDKFIGKGGEGFVFNVNKETVLKVYLGATKQYLEELIAIQKRLTAAQLPYATPQIFRIGESGDLYYTMERKLAGKQLETIFPTLSGDQKLKVLKNFIEAIEPLKGVGVSELPYGQLIKTEECIQANTWLEYLTSKLDQRVKRNIKNLGRDVMDMTNKVELIKAQLEQYLKGEIEKHLVHADYYLSNVLVNEDLEIRALLDFSVHAVVGDHRLDLASINFLTFCPQIQPAHYEYVCDLISQTYGEDISVYLDLYGIFYAFYYAGGENGSDIYRWCLSILNDKSRWERL